MKKFSSLLFFTFFISISLFSQIENIQKKSNEHSNNQSKENTYSSSPSNDACTDACMGCFTDAFMQVAAQHMDYLIDNRAMFPNLFGIQTDGLVGIYPTNDIFALLPNFEANFAIIGMQGSYYRFFQQNMASFSVFTAADYYLTLNIGLFDGNSIQAGYGALSDFNSNNSFGAFVMAYNVYFNDYKSSLNLNYKQANDYNNGDGLVYMNAHILYKQLILQNGILSVCAVGGVKYQHFYGERLFFLSAGINLELF
jgi:hypothetical protein